MCESKPENEEHGSGVRWVPDIGVETPCDKPVVLLDGQFESEKGTKSFIAILAYESPEKDSQNTQQKCGCQPE